jgi:hypothetical protein
LSKPLLIELFCGLGAVSKVFEEEGWRAVGFDVERHVYGLERYPCQLVLQDVLTLHGRQFKDADFIWASPPCQEYSFMAMPWSRAKQIAKALRGECEFPAGYKGSRTVAELRALFDACFRIQSEASIASGRYIPMVVENVKGAQPWVGQAKANFGSFFLWGDVGRCNGNIVVPGAEFGDVLVAPGRCAKVPGMDWSGSDLPGYKAVAFNDEAVRQNVKVPGFNFHQFEQTGKPGGSFQSAAVGVKIHGSGDEYWFGSKGDTDSFGWEKSSPMRNCNSKSSARKAASAMIARIPEPLSRYLARAYKPCV